MDLHAVRCLDHYLTIFGKCLSAYLSVCMSRTFCGHCISRTNAKIAETLYSVAPWYNLVLIRFWFGFCDGKNNENVGFFFLNF